MRLVSSTLTLIAVLGFSACRHADQGSEPLAETKSGQIPLDFDKGRCADARAALFQCKDNTVLTHVGCDGPDYQVRCAPCSTLAFCAAGTKPVVIPECKSSDLGECVKDPAQAGVQVDKDNENGRRLSCSMPQASVALTFTNVGKQDMALELRVLKGYNKGKTYKAKSCKMMEGAIEAAYNCSVFTSTESGYNVSLASLGGSSLVAAVEEWNMVGKKPSENLGICK